nr:DUF5615 family PIN-like protein [Salsipaludibacter albus]
MLDEMWPLAAAARLRDKHAIEAHHVQELGLGGAPDSLVAEHARSHGMVVVTENVRDFAGEHELTIVFVLTRQLPVGGAMAASLADLLAHWAERVPEPARRPYWPRR